MNAQLRAKLEASRAPAPSVHRPAHRQMHQWAVVGIFLAVAVMGIDYAQPIVVPVLGAMLLGLLFGPTQLKLERAGVPPTLAAFLIVGALGLTVLAGLRAFLIPLETWVDRLPELWAALRHQLQDVRDLLLAVRDASDAVQESAGIEPGPDSVTVEAPNILGGLAIGIPAVAAQLVLCITALFFFLSARTQLRIGLLSLCLGRRSRLKTARIIQDAERAITTYVGTVSVINVGMALISSVTFLAIGLPNAVFWGVMVGVLNFIPYLGPAIMTALLIGVGLVEDYQGYSILLPAAAYFLLNFIEANFVTPAILGRRMTVQPLLVVISIAFWLWLWGPIGAILAVPILLVTQVVTLRLIR